MIRSTMAALLAAATLAGAAPAAAGEEPPAYYGDGTAFYCVAESGNPRPVHERACNVYAENVWSLVNRVWPRHRQTSWSCEVTGLRGLRCTFVVTKRLGGTYRMVHAVTFRLQGGRCNYRWSRDDFTGRAPFAPAGCLVALREDV